MNEVDEEQPNDSSEKHNESIRKSSGFSSFSSLLSSNEHPTLTRTRSSSLPSIPHAISSSTDSGNFSLNDRSINLRTHYRSRSFIEQLRNYTSGQSNSLQSSKTFIQGDSSTNEDQDDNQISDVEMRLTQSEIIECKEATLRQSTTKEQKRKSGSCIYIYISKTTKSGIC